MTGFTSPDALPFPDDYQQPADSPSAFSALAHATQTALTLARDFTKSRVIDTLQGYNVDYAPSQRAVKAALDQVDTTLGNLWQGLAGKAAIVHTHKATDAGVYCYDWNVGTLTAGQEKEAGVAIPANAAVFVTVQHPSTWIFAVANVTNATSVTLKVRNSTSTTTHSNVHIGYMVVVR